MSILQEVEALHCPTQRNVLKILSQDTRHTKVVNLACGTHRCCETRYMMINRKPMAVVCWSRVSDELKKHYLTDIEGTQYTTNLDRNRYGADNQYMFTGIPCAPFGLLFEICCVQISDSTQFINAGVVSLSGRCGSVGSKKQRNSHGLCWH